MSNGLDDTRERHHHSALGMAHLAGETLMVSSQGQDSLTSTTCTTSVVRRCEAESLVVWDQEPDRPPLVTASTLGRRQAEWDRQMELNEQREGELLTVQWKLVREQVGTLTRELSFVQTEIKEAMTAARRAMSGVERCRQENDERNGEDCRWRAAFSESVESRFTKAKQDLEAEEKKRILGDSEVRPKIMALEDLLGTRKRENRALEQDMIKLNQQVAVAMTEMLSLKENLDQEVEERRSSVDSALHQVHNVQSVVLKEHRDQMTLTQENNMRGQVGLMEQIRVEMQVKHDYHNGKLASLTREVGSFLEDMPFLKCKVQEIDASLTLQTKEQQKGLEREVTDRNTREKKFERRIEDMMALAQKDNDGAKHELHEFFDSQMKSIKSKLLASFNEQMEATRASREGVFQQLLEQLERETESREEQVSSLTDQWKGHRLTLDGRMKILETGLKDAEQSQRRGHLEDMKDIETAQQRMDEQLERKIRDLREVFQDLIQQERTCRETQAGSIEDYMEYLDLIMQDFRGAALKTRRAPRLRKSTPRELTGTHTSLTVTESVDIGGLTVTEKLDIGVDYQCHS